MLELIACTQKPLLNANAAVPSGVKRSKSLVGFSSSWIFIYVDSVYESSKGTGKPAQMHRFAYSLAAR